RLCGISVRGQPNNDESDDQFDDFPHCRSFRVQRFSVSGIQPSSLAAVFAVPSKANIRHNSSTTIRSPLFGSDIGVHVEEVDEYPWIGKRLIDETGLNEPGHATRVACPVPRVAENMISSHWSRISSKRSMYTLLSCPLTLT